MDEIQFKKLKRDHEEAQQKASEARGALRTLKERLRKEFNLNDLPEARKKLAELETESAQAKQTFEENLARYRKGLGDG